MLILKIFMILGVDGANLMIKPGYLGQGQPYQLRLESGSAFTVKLLHVVYPPYSGTCSSQITVGMLSDTEILKDGPDK